MSIDVSQLIIDKYYIDKNNKDIARLLAENEEKEARIKKHCPHATYKVEENYSTGGYDHISSVTIAHICTLCGKVLKQYLDPKHKGSYA